MPRHTPFLMLAALLITGCGSGTGDGGTAQSPAAGDSAAKPTASDAATSAVSTALVTWMGDWCAAEGLLEFPEPLSLPDTTTDADRKSVAKFLADSHSTVTKTKKAVAKLGPAPTADAKGVLADYRKDIGDMHKKTSEARTKVLVYPGYALASLYRLTAMEQVTFKGVAGYLDGHPDLEAAYKRAPDC